MIIREWQENGEQMRMFTRGVYCRVCKRWSDFQCTTVGDKIECGNPTCKVRGIITENGGIWYLGRNSHV